MFLKKKRNNNETIYDGAIGMKKTFQDSSIDMKSRLVGFLKQPKNSVSDWSIRRNATACNFLTAVAFPKTVWD